MNKNQKIMKRIFDITFSLFVCLFILSWIIPIIGLLIIIDSKGGIFYIQTRNGRNGKPFSIIKLRTMYADNNNSETIKNNKRITKLGYFLRKTSLDELPQFLNVLIGNMSVVGPRPHIIKENNEYINTIYKYNLRNSVKPGITGLAQIKGFRGEVKNILDINNRIISDIYYIKNYSLKLDIYIIYQTIFKVIKGDEKAI